MRILLIASLSAIGACSAAASPPMLAGAPDEPVSAYAEPADVSCNVRTTRTAHGVRFEARAASETDASGEYEFVITKRDRGGSSDIVQGGEFDLIAGEAQSLGSAEVSVERGGSYSARLVLRDAGGVACSAERST